MAYITLNDFSIHSSKPLLESFEVDDNIAGTISLLNQKGYLTEYCCSGHPLSDDRIQRIKEKDLSTIPRALIKRVIAKKENYSLVEIYDVGDSCYIKFNENIQLPDVPERFEQGDGDIYHLILYFDNNYNRKDDSVVLEEIKQINEILYNWALSLPYIYNKNK